MKHTNKTIILALVLFCSLVSCSLFNDPGIVGTWTLVSITNGSQTQTVDQLGYSQSFTFTESGNFSRTTNEEPNGEGSYTYNTSDGFLKLTPTSLFINDISLGSGTSSVIDDVFDRGYFDSVTNSNMAEIYHRK